VTTLLLLVVDFYFFEKFGERLNQKAIQYLRHDYVYLTVLDQYPVFPALLGTAVVSFGSGFFFWRWGLVGGLYGRPPWQTIFLPLFSLSMAVMGIHGSAGPARRSRSRRGKKFTPHELRRRATDFLQAADLLFCREAYTP
jgi:hypothetical protein